MIIAVLKYGVAPNIGGIAFGEEFQTGPVEVSQKILDEFEDGMLGVKVPSFDVRVDKISDDRFDIICDVTYMYFKYFIEVSTNQDTVEAKSYYYETSGKIENKAYIHMKRTGAGFERDWYTEYKEKPKETSGENVVGCSYTKVTGKDGTILSYEKRNIQDGSYDPDAALFQIFDGTYAIQIKDTGTETEPEAKIADSDGKVISNPSGEAEELLKKYKTEFTTRMEQGVDFFTIKKLPDDFDLKFDDPIFNKIEPSQI